MGINRKVCITLFLVWVATNSASTSAGLFGPADYDECILENMKDVSDKSAAYSIRTSCRAKFPETPNESTTEMPEVDINKIEAEAWWTGLANGSDVFGGEFYKYWCGYRSRGKSHFGGLCI